MDYIDAVKMFAGQTRPNNINNVTQTEATAREDSKDGSVLVDFDGVNVAGNDDQSITVSTSAHVKKGDRVMVSLVGADGTGKSPTVTGVIGGGDRTQGEIDGLSATVTQANKDISDAKQEIADFKDTADATYSTKTEVDEKTKAITDTLTADYTKTSDLETKFAEKAEVTKAVDDLSATVSATYETKDDVAKTYATQASLKETSDTISASVSDSLTQAKTYADGKVSDEVTARNAAIKEQADNITSTVSATYATKDALSTQVKQSADSITTTISQTYATQSTLNTTNNNVAKAQNTANTANTTANNLSTIIREDSSGVTVGKSTDGGKTYSGSRSTLGSSGLTVKDKSGTQLASFGSTATIGKSSQTHVNVDSDSLDILNGSSTTLATFGASEVDIGKNSKTAQIKLAGNSVIFGRYGTGNSYTSIDSVDGVYIMAPSNKTLALASYHTNNNGTKVLDDAGVGVVNDKVSIKGPTEIISTNLTINGHKVNPNTSTITMAIGWTNRDSQVRVSGYIVNIWLNVTHAANPAVGSLIATIPSSLAPAVEQDFAGTAWANTPDRAWVTVTTSGQIKLKQYYGGGTGQIKCSMTYVMKG